MVCTRMKSLRLVAQNGGAGKATLAVHLAVYAAMRGEKVTLIDTHPQRSTAEWWRARASSRPAMAECNVQALSNAYCPDPPRPGKSGRRWCSSRQPQSHSDTSSPCPPWRGRHRPTRAAQGGSAPFRSLRPATLPTRRRNPARWTAASQKTVAATKRETKNALITVLGTFRR